MKKNNKNNNKPDSDIKKNIEFNLYKIKAPLEKCLVKLVEKMYEKNNRVIIYSPVRERIEHLNNYLWTYTPSSFLPHGIVGNEYDEYQPILLFNKYLDNYFADYLVLLDDYEYKTWANNVNKIVVFFDDENEEITKLYNEIKENINIVVNYWQQLDNGKWEKI